MLLRQKAELASRYDEGHPKLNHVEAEAEDLTRKIQAEVEKIVSGTTSELALQLEKRSCGASSKSCTTPLKALNAPRCSRVNSSAKPSRAE